MLRLLLEIQSVKSLVCELDERIQKIQATGTTIGNVKEIEIQLQDAMQRSARKLDSRGIWKTTSRMAWPLWGKEEVQEGLATIERFKNSINTWLGMSIWSKSEIIRTVKHFAREEREHHEHISNCVRDVAQSYEQHHQAGKRDEIIEWYSPLNFFLRQADILSTRQPGTGQWLLEDARFKAWISGTGKKLWCRGMPGAGKTVLASIVVDTLRTDLAREDIGVAAIYLNHKETDANSPSMLSASLWRQLVVKKSISSTLHQLYNNHREPRTRPTEKDDDTILRSIISEYSRVFILVDALDEYPERQRDALLRRISALGTTVNIKIDHIFPDSTLDILEVRATGHDIRRHIDAQISQSSQFSKLLKTRPGLREEIEAEVAQRSDGMFLLAKLHLDTLTTLLTVKARLNGAYDEVVDRINRQSEGPRKVAWLALSWITNARRPLRPSELREALAVEPNTTALNPDNLLDMDTIIYVCTGLVVCNEEDDTIRLIHYTTQEYMQQIQAQAFPNASTEITMTCITYLSFEVVLQYLQPPSLRSVSLFKGWQALFRQHPLLDYAIRYCLIYALGEAESNITHSILSFLARCSPWPRLFSFTGARDARGHTLPSHASRLWIAAAFHLKEICRHLIQEESISTNSELCDAVIRHHTDTIQLLLENGADVGGAMHAALQRYAQHRDWRDVIKLLVEHGADVNTTGNFGTALHSASKYGDFEIARLLIEHGVDLHARAYSGIHKPHTALYEASSKGQNEICRLLIDHGADVNTEGGEYKTALNVASVNGYHATARILIEHGADASGACTIRLVLPRLKPRTQVFHQWEGSTSSCTVTAVEI
ncbi:hypothetical protein FB451DRAFT_1205699 [Mycena latifolia]|nr:hypothetical protein FB451DRAFT_1205699 [Mycena latifolia]